MANEERHKTKDKHRNKVKPMPFKFPEWFRAGLKAAQTKTPRRTATEIIMEAVRLKEKIKKPKDHKYVRPIEKD
jgi:hypothetical protein